MYVDAKLSVIRERAVGDGFHEELTVLNHADEPVDLVIRIDAASDFADLFEVKDALEKKGSYSARVEGGRLLLGYERETIGVRRRSRLPRRRSLTRAASRSGPGSSPMGSGGPISMW